MTIALLLFFILTLISVTNYRKEFYTLNWSFCKPKFELLLKSMCLTCIMFVDDIINKCSLFWVVT